MRKRHKPKKPAARKPAPVPVVKKVALPETGIVQVVVPKDVLPIIHHDPHRGVVEIAPVKPAEGKQAKSWWQHWLGQ